MQEVVTEEKNWFPILISFSFIFTQPNFEQIISVFVATGGQEHVTLLHQFLRESRTSSGSWNAARAKAETRSVMETQSYQRS